MDRAGLEEAPLEFGAIAKAIESIQERVEGYNFDIRKHVLEYDDVVNKQREVVYKERAKILSREDLHDDLLEMVTSEIRRIVEPKTQGDEDEWDMEGMLAELRQAVPALYNDTAEKFHDLTPDEIIKACVKDADRAYWLLNQRIGEDTYRAMRQEETSLKALAETPDPFTAMIVEIINTRIGRDVVAQWYDQPIRRMPTEIEEQVKQIVIDVQRIFRDRRLMLQQLDGHWIRHLTDLDMLREGIGLRAIGQQKPIVAYQKEAYETYQEMLRSVQTQIVRMLFLIPQQPRRPSQGSPQWGGFRGSQPRQPVLRTSGGSDQAASKPMPARASAGGQKLGRNDPCFCGSGKKYKDCHLKADQRANVVRYITQK